MKWKKGFLVRAELHEVEVQVADTGNVAIALGSIYNTLLLDDVC